MATSSRALRIYERVILVAISALGLLYLAFLAYFTWRSLQQKLVDGIYWFELGVQGDLLPSIPIPTTGTATVSGFGDPSRITVNSVDVNVSDLSAGSTALMIATHVTAFLLYAVLVSAVIYLCVRLLRGRPFARSMTIAAVVVAVALIVLGSATDVMGEYLRNGIQSEILGTGTPPEPFSGGSSFSFPGGYLMAGLAVAALALAFRIGENVQRDTEGLV